jgi:type IV pilus assembly protein PilM
MDLGRFSHKAVALQRKGSNRYVLTHYATLQHNELAESPAMLAEQIKALLGELKATGKGYTASVSGGDSIVRIIEQPETPPTLLRDAIRLNGMTLLNQDVRQFVIDCDQISHQQSGPGTMHRYLVAALPRKQVLAIQTAMESNRIDLDTLQIGPICALNAFEFSAKQRFSEKAFLLVDIGHLSSTVIVGARGEIVLVRTIEYGGRDLIEALSAIVNGDRQAALAQLSAGDEMLTDAARYSLTALAREISSSIGFFEARREENVEEIHVAGGPAGSQSILQILAEELHMPCKAWNPFERCEIALPEAQRGNLMRDVMNLHVACGAAAELLKAN